MTCTCVSGERSLLPLRKTDTRAGLVLATAKSGCLSPLAVPLVTEPPVKLPLGESFKLKLPLGEPFKLKLWGDPPRASLLGVTGSGLC